MVSLDTSRIATARSYYGSQLRTLFVFFNPGSGTSLLLSLLYFVHSLICIKEMLAAWRVKGRVKVSPTRSGLITSLYAGSLKKVEKTFPAAISTTTGATSGI